MNLKMSYVAMSQKKGLLVLFVALILLGAAVPIDAAQYSFTVPLPHKEKYMAQPVGDEDPHNEVLGIGQGDRVLSSFSVRIRFTLFRCISTLHSNRWMLQDRQSGNQTMVVERQHRSGSENGTVGIN